ncbi:testis-expressed protein 13D-like [Equus asinus]|uniref:testis-expressed protein 13D-like n=1 Tax=Equus asinus TaxID=9793 RepID=UPI0038F763C5
MAVDLGDHRSGFQHSEVVVFINEEVLSNGGGPDFYLTFCSRPWNEIENELRSILADPQVPFPIKRACAWSALALSVRVAARQREQQARRVRQLQEQVEERETVVWALASQLQQLRAEREKMVSQLRCARDDLRRVLEEREVLRGQLLQPKRLPQEVARRSRAPQLGIEVWPMTAEERNKVLAERSQRWHESQREEAQMASTTGVLYVPEPPSPWAQVVQPSLPMPFPTPLPYPPPPLPRVVSEAAAAAGTAFPPRMPNGGIYPPGMWPAAGFQEETALQWHQSSQGQKEGPLQELCLQLRKLQELRLQLRKLQKLRLQLRKLQELRLQLRKLQELRLQLRKLQELRLLLRKLQELCLQLRKLQELRLQLKKLQELCLLLRKLQELRLQLRKLQELCLQLRKLQELRLQLRKLQELCLQLRKLQELRLQLKKLQLPVCESS